MKKTTTKKTPHVANVQTTRSDIRVKSDDVFRRCGGGP